MAKKTTSTGKKTTRKTKSKSKAIKKPKPISAQDLPKVHRNLPPIWVDTMGIAVRGDIPIATLVFYSVLPDRNETIEAVRIQTSLAHIMKMIKVLEGTIEKIEPSENSTY